MGIGPRLLCFFYTELSREVIRWTPQRDSLTALFLRYQLSTGNMRRYPMRHFDSHKSFVNVSDVVKKQNRVA